MADCACIHANIRNSNSSAPSPDYGIRSKTVEMRVERKRFTAQNNEGSGGGQQDVGNRMPSEVVQVLR